MSIYTPPQPDAISLTLMANYQPPPPEGLAVTLMATGGGSGGEGGGENGSHGEGGHGENGNGGSGHPIFNQPEISAMNVRFIHDGDAIDFQPEQDTPSGSVVVMNDLVGITKLDIAAGVLGALAVTGVFDFPKASGVDTAIAAGAKVYWDAADEQATTTASSNTYVGKAVLAATDADDLVRVRLEQ